MHSPDTPEIAPGLAFVVKLRVETQPLVAYVKEMLAVPAANAAMAPELPIVTTDVVPLDQVPLESEVLSVDVAPLHNDETPDRAALGLTVTCCIAKQPPSIL